MGIAQGAGVHVVTDKNMDDVLKASGLAMWRGYCEYKQRCGDLEVRLAEIMEMASSALDDIKPLPLVDCDACGQPNKAAAMLMRDDDPRFEKTILVKTCPDCGSFAQHLSTEITR